MRECEYETPGSSKTRYDVDDKPNPHLCPRWSRRWLLWNKHPRKGDKHPHANRNTEGARRANLCEDSPTKEGTEEERYRSDEPVVSRKNLPADVEQTGVGHELHPDSCEHDYRLCRGW